MTSARDALNRLKWTGEAPLDDVLVTYVHRGAPGDVRTVRASDIVVFGRSFFELRGGRGRMPPHSSSIPYHRVRRIATLRGGEILWERSANVHGQAP